MAVLSVLEQELDNPLFNDIHLGAAFTRLARNKQSFTAQVRSSALLARLLQKARTACEANELNPWATGNIFYAVASLATQAPDVRQLVPALVDFVRFQVGEMGAQGVANAIWACATLQLADRDLQALMPLLVQQALEVADAFNPQEVSNMIWAAATLKSKAPALLDALPFLSEVAAEKAAKMNTLDAAQVIWAGGILKGALPDESKGELEAAISAATLVIRAKAGQMSGQQLANACWGLALGSWSDSQTMNAIAAATVQGAPRWSQSSKEMDLPQIACAFAKLQTQSFKLLQAVAENTASDLHRFNNWGICALAWSFEQLDVNRSFAEYRGKVGGELALRKLGAQAVQQSQLGPEEWLRWRRSH